MKNRLVLAGMILGMLVLAAGLVAAAQDEPADFSGKWETKMETQRGERTITFNFEQKGTELKGTMSGGFGGRRGGGQRSGGGQRRGGGGGETSFTGKVEGNTVTFTIKRETPRGTFETTYTGKLEGDTIKGKMKNQRGERDWTAKKIK